VLLACAAISTCFAQQGPHESSLANARVAAAQQPARARLLNQDEGLAVLGAALESRHHPPARRDCSHFVHTIYERAGFPYSYENSVSMYGGTAEFERVRQPQPGDLIVWRGHMGIVVNPVQRSFFSALRTGLGVETYDSRYWKRRGTPRFFRYVKSAVPAMTLVAATPNSALPESAADEDTDTEFREPLAATAPPQEPETALLITGRPTTTTVRQALDEAFDSSSANFAPANLLSSSKAVIIFDNFQIRKVHLKRDSGWAEIQMNEPSSLIAGQAYMQRRSERQRWPLIRRGKNDWQLVVPSNATYISKDTAVRLLAHQLAAIMADGATPRHGSPQEAQLARLLDSLLGE